MPAKNDDLHGNVPDNASAALLLVDVINDLEFDTGAALLEHALPVAHRIADLKRRAKAAGIPAVYVNDNFGIWRSDFNRQVAHCIEDGVRGGPIALALRPEDDDYFVLKPKHSGFYSSALDVLLSYLGAETLVITGFTGDICVLFTAHDAYMRDFHLLVPADCVASADPARNQQALEQMGRVLGADLRASTEIDLSALAAGRGGPVPTRRPPGARRASPRRR